MRGPVTLALALVAGSALAGSPADPEAPDPAGDTKVADACLDILGAWIESDADGALGLGLAVSACDVPYSNGMDRWWGLTFVTPRGTFIAHAFGWDPVERPTDTGSCPYWYFQEGASGTLGSNHKKADCEFVPGSPALLRFAYDPELERVAPGDPVTLRYVAAGYVFGGYAPLEIDLARPVRAYVQPAPVVTEPANGTGEPAAPESAPHEDDAASEPAIGPAEASPAPDPPAPEAETRTVPWPSPLLAPALALALTKGI
ncbi:MAG: hypothetical protein ACT4PT_11645 [Methanobacteriota archaeon]